ncbi:MAG: selenide, water dikinase SelD [Acidobacteriota bacterium]
MAPRDLAQVLSRLPKLPINNKLLVGFETADDAGVYKLTEELALVQTVDFFTPIVDDPYIFGRIAAINSLSDIWAMGGDTLTALAIAAFPMAEVPQDVLAEIVRGGAEALMEHDVSLLGGHTVEDHNLKFGYAITGIIDPKKIILNSSAQAGDTLVLTKRLGTGIIGTAIKFGCACDEAVTAATEGMLTSNRLTAEIMRKLGVHAATDVTGFGLLGHSYEMAKGSRVTFQINPERVLVLPKALDLAAEKILTRGDRTNREYLGKEVEFAPEVSDPMRSVLFDPQTSGGMLISISAEKAPLLLAELLNAGIVASEIGRVVEYSGKYLQIKPAN